MSRVTVRWRQDSIIEVSACPGTDPAEVSAALADEAAAHGRTVGSVTRRGLRWATRPGERDTWTAWCPRGTKKGVGTTALMVP